MRIISDEALDFIAGGTGDDASKSIPVVTVVAPYNPGHDSGPGPVDPGHPPVSSPEPPHDCPVVHSSPVPADAPKDVDMNKLRNTVLDVANMIKGMDPGIEHGAIIVRSPDGTLRVGTVAHGTADDIAIAVDLSTGEKIVGYIHSHPENSIEQKLPSRYDFDQAYALRATSNADKGMMLYILDNASGDVFEYHAGTSRNTTRTGPNITDDTSQPCH